jgi:hypothetical protein
LGKVVPLEIKTSLGALANVGSPWFQAIVLGDNCDGRFLDVLLRYKKALDDYEKFKESNPNYDADIANTKKMDSENDKFQRFISHQWTI